LDEALKDLILYKELRRYLYLKIKGDAELLKKLDEYDYTPEEREKYFSFCILGLEKQIKKAVKKLPTIDKVDSIIDRIMDHRESFADLELELDCFGKKYSGASNNCKKCAYKEICSKKASKWKYDALKKGENPNDILRDALAYGTKEELIEIVGFTIEGFPDDDKLIAASFGYADLAKRWPEGFILNSKNWTISEEDESYLQAEVDLELFDKYLKKAQFECLRKRGFNHKDYQITRRFINKALGKEKDLYQFMRLEGLQLGATSGLDLVLMEALEKIHDEWINYRKDSDIQQLIKNGFPVTLKSRNFRGRQYIVELREEGVIYKGYETVKSKKLIKDKIKNRIFPSLGSCSNWITKARTYSGKRFFKVGRKNQ